jgi:hypothetical protein
MNTSKTQFKRKKRVRLLLLYTTIVLLFFAITACSDSSTNASEAEPESIPEVTTELFQQQFEVPEDLKVTCLTGDTEPGFPVTRDCPVLKWLDHTYWALSFKDNRGSMSMVAINSEGEIAGRWDQDGDRCIWKIELDEEAETATLIGQAAREIVVMWDDLRIEE